MVVVVVVVERRKASPIASKKKKRESEKKEIKHTHKNIKRICSRAGTTAGRVFKRTYFYIFYVSVYMYLLRCARYSSQSR